MHELILVKLYCLQYIYNHYLPVFIQDIQKVVDDDICTIYAIFPFNWNIVIGFGIIASAVNMSFLTGHVSIGLDCKDSISYEKKDWESKKTPDNGFLALAIWAIVYFSF